MKNWNLQRVICFCGLFTWIYRLWLMVQVWWKFRTFTLFPSLPTSVKVNCCCCIFSRELGWECKRVNFLLNMGAHPCLDSPPVIRFMHSSVHVLAFMGWAVNFPCVCDPPEQGELSLGANSRAGSQQRLQHHTQGCWKYSQDCETEHMQIGMVVRENNFIPDASKHSSGFKYGMKKTYCHQPLDSCIATKGSDCSTDSRSSARWGVQRSAELVDL